MLIEALIAGTTALAHLLAYRFWRWQRWQQGYMAGYSDGAAIERARFDKQLFDASRVVIRYGVAKEIATILDSQNYPPMASDGGKQ